ncbi:MAG TPA: multicopper oxidase family protein [Polyangia bacterium]|jgi:FtsP/CotA-like multicopper oxidase with cupredoxin domain|nr:multicopper oxidase family protein [Polyangia bacterium]
MTTAPHRLSSPSIPQSLAREPREIHVELEARETAWEISPDRTVSAWGYEGSVPGPTIVAHVGDTLVAHLVNNLPEATSIHWHGLRLPAPMDGTQLVQRLVQPGDAFEYRFALPDAGTFWYHSHANETVQIERGLYGALVVLGPDEPAFDADRLLVLDDVKLDRHGNIAKTALFDRHSGREGKVLVINGRSEPEYEIAAGQIERWRVVNACSARYVRLSLGGRAFRAIGGDGGLRTDALTVNEMLLAPAERVELAVGPFEDEGAEIAIESLPYRRTSVKRPRRDRWGTLRVGPRAPSGTSIPAISGVLAAIEPLVPVGPVQPTRTVRLGARMTLHGHDWLINDEQHHHDAPVKVGELQVWELVNETGMDHPFHLHGFFFQVIAKDGTPTVPRSWEDTVNLPAKGRVTIAFRPDDRPGKWMYHCHILEHHAAGMMGHFEVVR